MSVQIYHTSTILNDLSVVADILRESVAILCAHTPATVYQTITDDAYEYDVVVYAGYGNRYFRLAVSTNGTSTYSRTFYKGYLDNGAFVSTGNTSATTTTIINRASRVFVINGGEIWTIEQVGGRYYSGSNYVDSVFATSVKIKPQYSNDVLGAAAMSDGDNPTGPFNSVNTTVFFNGAERALSHTANEKAHYNVPSGTMLLMPSLITMPTDSHIMGVPTIDGHTCYFMSTNQSYCTEFYVNGVRYVSMGPGGTSYNGIAIISE